jgi:hypothetical protein
MPDLTVDEFLAHHGVKGMRWGVNRERTPERIQKNLNNIEKSRNSISRRILPGSVVITGAGALAGSSKKVLKLREEKTSSGDKRLVPTEKSPLITDQNRAALQKKVERRAYAEHTTKGALAVSALLATAYFGKTHVSDPELASLVTKGALLLAGLQTIHTTTIDTGIHRNVVDRKLYERKKALKKELKLSTSRQS